MTHDVVGGVNETREGVTFTEVSNCTADSILRGVNRMATENYLQLDGDLGDLLQEFNDVVKELSTSHVYDQRLVKRPTGSSDAEDSDYSSETSLGNSLNASEEELNVTGMSTVPTAIPADSSDLQRFIEKLDRELAEM